MIDKPLLAVAVSRARSLHIDAQGRIAQAQRTEKQLKRLQNMLHEVTNDMRNYVTKPGPPWIIPRSDVYPNDD